MYCWIGTRLAFLARHITIDQIGTRDFAKMTETTPSYIQALQKIPKQTFLFGPSPIQFLPRLSNELSPNGDVKIWAKRDDCNRYVVL